MAKITGSVGRGGENRLDDVRLIQGLLNNYAISDVTKPLDVDGIIGSKTFTRIELFQSKIMKTVNPDGLVDPDGQTFLKLINRPGSSKASSLSLSVKAGKLLKLIEGLATTPYDDQTGKEITEYVKGATIGYGHLINEADWNKYKNGISATEAASLFEKDLLPYVETVSNTVTLPVMQHEFDAMVILTFNIGNDDFVKSSVLKLVNNPGAKTDYPDLETAWRAWNKSQGIENQGLINRRNAEWNMYAKNIYERW